MGGKKVQVCSAWRTMFAPCPAAACRSVVVVSDAPTNEPHAGPAVVGCWQQKFEQQTHYIYDIVGVNLLINNYTGT